MHMNNIHIFIEIRGQPTALQLFLLDGDSVAFCLECYKVNCVKARKRDKNQYRGLSLVVLVHCVQKSV